MVDGTKETEANTKETYTKEEVVKLIEMNESLIKALAVLDLKHQMAINEISRIKKSQQIQKPASFVEIGMNIKIPESLVENMIVGVGQGFELMNMEDENCDGCPNQDADGNCDLGRKDNPKSKIPEKDISTDAESKDNAE